MSNNIRVIGIFFFNFFLLIALGELNHNLTSFAVYLNLDVLFLLCAGLYLRLLHGVILAVVIALTMEATNPLPFGTRLIAFLAIWFIIVEFSRRIQRNNPSHVRTLAVILQFVWFLCLSVIAGQEFLDSGTFWLRTGTDLLLSCLTIMLLANFWVNFQCRFLSDLGWNLKAEPQRS